MWNFLFLCLQTFQIIPALSPELAPTSLDEGQEGGGEESQEMCCPLWKGSRWPSEGLALGMIQTGTRMPGIPGLEIQETGSSKAFLVSWRSLSSWVPGGTGKWREGLGDILQSSSLPSNGTRWPGRPHGLALGHTRDQEIHTGDQEIHRDTGRCAPQISC